MEIWIEFDKGKWRISPDPARIPRGSILRWRFRADSLGARHARWTVYFQEAHPFTYQGYGGGRIVQQFSIVVETSGQSDGQHVGSSPAITTDRPGEYKYGIHLQDTDEERELGDEDPYIIVI